MGWGGGSRLFSSVIDVIQEEVLSGFIRNRIYRELIPAFKQFDCDTLGECLGQDIEFDRVYGELYPDDEEDLA